MLLHFYCFFAVAISYSITADKDVIKETTGPIQEDPYLEHEQKADSVSEDMTKNVSDNGTIVTEEKAILVPDEKSITDTLKNENQVFKEKESLSLDTKANLISAEKSNVISDEKVNLAPNEKPNIFKAPSLVEEKVTTNQTEKAPLVSNEKLVSSENQTVPKSNSKERDLGPGKVASDREKTAHLGPKGNDKVLRKTGNLISEKAKVTQDKTDQTVPQDEKPNIVFIVADDLGWGDVSFHGSDVIMTPNIDTLAYHGIILKQYYTDTQGTSSRSALFTGKYPMRLGMQGDSIAASEDRGIPLSEKLLPAYLKELGYSVHMIGKWNIGKSQEQYLPTSRGFDSFYGFLDSAVDSYTYNFIEDINGTSYFGLGLFNDTEPVEDRIGHITDIITERAVNIIRDHNPSVPLYLHIAHAAPHAGGGLVSLQPPIETIAANDHIAHSARRMYAGLVTSLDRSIGLVVGTLAEKELLRNTIIVFVSDNGAPTVGLTQNFGSNEPFRGIKSTPWEGGIRSPALVWHHSAKPTIWNGMFHVTDWLPTLVSAAKGDLTKKVDGVDQWRAINNDEASQRDEFVITVDDIKGFVALRSGDYKIILGNVGKDLSGHYDEYLAELRKAAPIYENSLYESDTWLVFQEALGITMDIEAVKSIRNSTNVKQINVTTDKNLCFPTTERGCLFNITADPLEAHDLWESRSDIVQKLVLKLRTSWNDIVPRKPFQMDHRANPALHDYVWYPWTDNVNKLNETVNIPWFPLKISADELHFMVDLNIQSFKEKIYGYINTMSKSFVQSVSSLYAF